MWVCHAEGGDAAPAFTTTSTGTAASAQMTCYLIELTGADYNSTVPVTGVVTGTTAASLTVTGGANVPCAGCYAITSWNVVQSPAATQSWTPGSSWVNKSSTGAGTYTSQAFCDVYANPPAGAALSEIGTHGARMDPPGGCDGDRAAAYFKSPRSRSHSCTTISLPPWKTWRSGTVRPRQQLPVLHSPGAVPSPRSLLPAPRMMCSSSTAFAPSI